MKHVAFSSFPVSRLFSARLFAVVLCVAVGAAYADDYGDVNQLSREGKASEALAKADAYIASKPRDPQMRFLRGVILTEQGKQADATAAFTSLTQDFPELPEPYNNLAALYAAQSQFDKARAALEMAIKLNPGYATAYENLGDVYARLSIQQYVRAQQFASTSPSVTAKLKMVRELFGPAKPSADQAPLPAAPSSIKKPASAK